MRKANKGEVAYIAGKINGFPNYKEKFEKAQKYLESLGYIVMNPAELPEGMPYIKYMPICLAMLEQSDIIYMLDNWTDSKGAPVELSYANVQRKKAYYESEEC